MLPLGHEPNLFWSGRRDNRTAVISPKMSSGDLSSVACVTDHNSGSGVHEFLELEYIALVGWREVNGGQPTVLVNGRMELEAVMPSLPVLAKGGYATGNLVSVGTYL